MKRTSQNSQGWGVEIFRGHDEYGAIHVFDDGNKRYLTFDNLNEQTCQHKAHPEKLMHEYSCAMLLPLVFLQPQRACLFGLGGGSLVHWLLARNPQLQLQVVELRQAVAKIAYQFFELPSDERLRVLVEDAGVYVKEAADNCTDFLMCDMYHAFRMDKQQREEDFIRHCHRLLSPGGWMAVNFSAKSDYSEHTLDLFRSQFAEVRRCTVQSGNQVLYAGKQPCPYSDRELQHRAKALNADWGYAVTKFLKLWGKLPD